VWYVTAQCWFVLARLFVGESQQLIALAAQVTVPTSHAMSIATTAWQHSAPHLCRHRPSGKHIRYTSCAHSTAKHHKHVSRDRCYSSCEFVCLQLATRIRAIRTRSNVQQRAPRCRAPLLQQCATPRAALLRRPTACMQRFAMKAFRQMSCCTTWRRKSWCRLSHHTAARCWQRRTCSFLPNDCCMAHRYYNAPPDLGLENTSSTLLLLLVLLLLPQLRLLLLPATTTTTAMVPTPVTNRWAPNAH
jgi:hypothetical protein